MIVFLVLRQSHLVRYYEPTLRLLAADGHTIHIGFPIKPGGRYSAWVKGFRPLLPGQSADPDTDDATGVELLSRIAADHPNISWGYIRQQRTDDWGEVLSAVRLCHDYTRFFDKPFRESGALRDRALSRGVPVFFQWLMKSWFFRPRFMRRAVRRVLSACQRAVPPSASAIAEILDVAPDVVLVARLVDFASPQDEYVRAANYLGIPVGLPVASWDNLTNKGLVRQPVDFLTVWNDHQKQEAIELHGIRSDRVWVTGAQTFDVWFDRKPSRDRTEFLAPFGFDPGETMIAYLGSSQSISGYEVNTVRNWLRELRAQTDTKLRNASVIVRPHPYHAKQWDGVDLSEFGPVEVYPREGAIPLSDDQRNDFFDTLFHSSAIVGLNTSAQVEAAILGRPVLILIDPTEEASRKGTLEMFHFRYLSDPDTGIASVSQTKEEHFAQLGRVIGEPPVERSRQFVARFIRPHGLDRPAAPILAEAILRGAAISGKRAEPKITVSGLVLRGLLKGARPLVAAQQRRLREDARAKKRSADPAEAGGLNRPPRPPKG